MAITTDFTDACEKYAAGDITHWWASGSCTIGNNDYPGTPLHAMLPTAACTTVTLTANIARTVIMRVLLPTTPGSTVNLLRFLSGSNPVGSLSMNASRQLLFRDAGAAALSGSTPSTALTTTDYYVIEAGWLMNNGAGRVELRINGTQVAGQTSIALGGTISNAINTTAGFTNCDTIEIASSSLLIPMTVDFFITRTATAVWSTPGDWFADSAAQAPFYLKKKTIQLLAGTAGNGAFTAGGTTWTIGAEPSGGTSQTDAIRTLPFPGSDIVGTGFMNGVDPGGNGTTSRDTLKLEQPPTDINVIKTCSHVAATRYTNAGFTHRIMVNNPVAPHAGAADSPTIYSALATYKGITWCMDTIPTDSTPWTTALLQTPLELGIFTSTVT